MDILGISSDYETQVNFWNCRGRIKPKANGKANENTKRRYGADLAKRELYEGGIRFADCGSILLIVFSSLYRFVIKMKFITICWFNTQ